MNYLFAPIKKVICPYDLTEIRYRQEVEQCPTCKSELPVRYLRGYDQALPFFAQIIGWSGVGKTVYLQALTFVLMQMGRVWRQSYAYAPLTEPTLMYVKNVREFEQTGKMPAPTQLAIQEAYIMMLTGMERWGGRTLVLRDVAGEVFDKLQFPLQYTPYLLHVPTTMLMISLDDMRRKLTQSMDDLMNSYIDTMMKHDKNFKRERRNVVVVLSKADLIHEELPANLQNYLVEDPILKAIITKTNFSMDGSNMQEYMTRLKHVSRAIQDWISQDPPGQNLIRLAKNNNISLEFTVVSSTGRKAGNSGSMPVQLEPYRVLDPFFWALELQSR